MDRARCQIRVVLGLVAGCKNLEWLEVDRTPITDSEFRKLAGLVQLRMLKAYGTGITDQSVSVVKELKALKIFIYGRPKLLGREFPSLKNFCPTCN